MAKTSRTKKSPVKKKPSATKKAASRAPTKKKAAVKKAAPKTKTVKKTIKKKVVKKTPAAAAKKKTKVTKKIVKKVVKKKPVSKKAASKKAGTKKPAVKKAAVKKKPAAKKTLTKKPAAAKTSKSSTKKPTPAPKGEAKTKAGSAAPASAAAKPGDSGKPGDTGKPARKGITIVSNRRPKRSRVKQPRKPFVTPGGNLLGPGVVRKPLIPSGPSAPSIKSTEDEQPGKLKKSPFNKRELTKFKNLLISKRAELFGDVEKMESDALRSTSGNLSKLPQHLADQGSDSYEQSLSLDLAAADRRMIKEIDDALARIDAKTYGLCERTFKPIRETRLQELPWARYSIEAAREMERRGGF